MLQPEGIGQHQPHSWRRCRRASCVNDSVDGPHLESPLHRWRRHRARRCRAAIAPCALAGVLATTVAWRGASSS